MGATPVRSFRISHTEETTAAPEKIWALWSDVNNWPQWDLGLSQCRLDEEFAAGGKFQLRPRGSDQDITAELQDVEPNRRFSDVTRLPFGTIRASHEMDTAAGKTKVTHTIEADVSEEHADFFANVIWKNMQHGLPGSVQQLKQLAESR
jgi:uncharacterized protein YndB with AHSA1/START domain